MYLIIPAAAYVGQWLTSFKEFPPRQTPASFNLGQVMKEITNASNGGNSGRRLALRSASYQERVPAERRLFSPAKKIHFRHRRFLE